MEELLRLKVPYFEGCDGLDLAGGGCDLHKDCSDVVLEAGDRAGAVVPVPQPEGATTIRSGPALPAGVDVGGGRDGPMLTERSVARPGMQAPS